MENAEKDDNNRHMGSFNVVDLWGENQLKRWLMYSKLNQGKYMLRNIAKKEKINEKVKEI